MRTFCRAFFRLTSLSLSPPLSNDALYLTLTFERSCETSLTLTSDSRSAAQTSLRSASRTFEGGQGVGHHRGGRREQTLSSTAGALLSEERAELSFLPKSVRTMARSIPPWEFHLLALSPLAPPQFVRSRKVTCLFRNYKFLPVYTRGSNHFAPRLMASDTDDDVENIEDADFDNEDAEDEIDEDILDA